MSAKRQDSHEEFVLYSVSGNVATVTLNRPSALNSLHSPMRIQLGDALDKALRDDAVKSIVVAANGPGFSAGTDLEEAKTVTDTYALLEEEYKPLVLRIVNSPKPVIAAVHGVCAGVGASLALACDLMVMADDAFLFLAFAHVGLIPDGGMCWQLVNAMGYRRAYALVAEGGRLTAKECHDYGLANRIADAESLQATTHEWAAKLAEGAPLALKYAKYSLQQAMRSDLPSLMRLESGLQQICASSEDGLEGVTAFLEKRKPIFS